MRLKTLALVAALASGVAPAAFAGGFAPVVAVPEPVVVVEPTPVAPRSTLGVLLPLALVGALIAVAAANEDDETED